MPGEMGGIEGRMRGTVIRGEDIERVLAAVPEQAWQFDVGVTDGIANHDLDVEVPMAQRRAIVSSVLAVVQRDA